LYGSLSFEMGNPRHLADMAVPEATPVYLVPQNRFLQQLRHVTEADCQALSRVDPCGELRSGTSHLAEADIRTGGDVGTCAFQGIDQERIGSRQNLVIRIDKGDEIGRASCRERVESSEGEGSVRR